ncbi:WHG domain-containing protein [Kineococcus xinjiangensis]|uniref:WHG domain-containing protein n=1 Tax=Kineococcus xinjiangensis TaxID=512762 RepID=A0A2S6IVB1_9ACTN|nr:WHG domain-containing protein [Kineococcus xinjiangensis]PPK98176.1 WHG domain-containing protein [Kineococcus xinjiangensis]
MPRAGLNPRVVAQAAAAVSDDVGFPRLTLALVAERLGVRLPSLYKHIDSLDGLRRDLAVLATRELGEALGGAALGRSGADALHAVADAYRDYARRHPGRYAATVRAPDPGDAEHLAAADGVLRTVLAVLAGYGLAGDEAVDAARALRAALHGFATLEVEGGFGLPRDVDRSYRFLVAGLDAVLAGRGREA